MVVNIYKDKSTDIIYIGRGSPFGNPYSSKISKYKDVIYCETREEAIEKYEIWLLSDLEIVGWNKPTIEQIKELKGKKLGCYCKPKPCHGDILEKIANNY